MGWTFPWASSADSDFNTDFNVAITEEQQRKGGAEYNYRREEATTFTSRTTPDGVRTFATMSGTDPSTYVREGPGMSAFILDNGAIYHTYSTYARGLDRPLEHVPLARPRPQRPQRNQRLVAPPRRISANPMSCPRR